MAELVYITAPDHATAKMLAEGLIREGLAAGANITGPAESIYRWLGEIRRAQEWQIFIQTADAATLTAWVSARHPHQVPCIIALPISGGFGPFLDWIRENGGETCRQP